MQKWIFGVAMAAVWMLAGCVSARMADAGQGVPAATTAGAGRGGRGGSGQGGGGGLPAGLRGAMNEMQTMMLAIKADVKDPGKVEETVRNISIVERDVVLAKLQTPQYANGLPTAEDKEKVMAAYHSMLNELTRALLDLEDAVVAKKAEDIKKAIDQIEKLEQAGHKEFGMN